MSHKGDEVVIDSLESAPHGGERQPHQRAERAMSDLPKISVDDPPPNDGPTPEQALKDAQAALANKDKDIETANRARAAAERTAAEARDATARERQGRAGDRKALVTQAVEGAKSDRQAAISAIRTAREAGDFDAEMRAQESLNSADYRLNQGTAELAGMGDGKDPTSTAGDVREQNGGRRDQAAGPSQAAQAWINKHPEFNRNNQYKDAMLAAHGRAVLDGASVDSPAYFRYLDEADASWRGQSGGGMGGGNNGGGDDRRGNGKDNSHFDGAPPSRGNGGGSAGSRQVQTMLGPVGVTRLNNGKISIQIPRDIRDNFEEGAKISNMGLGEYALEQVRIAEERAAGGTGGLVTTEGQKFQ